MIIRSKVMTPNAIITTAGSIGQLFNILFILSPHQYCLSPADITSVQ
jgi:hypothetical protein